MGKTGDREKYEQPPDLTDEDEEILDRVWAKISAEEEGGGESDSGDGEEA